MTMLTKEALAEIEQRHKAATPGPWHPDKYNAYIWGPDGAMVADSGGAQGLPAGADATTAVIRARGVGGGLPIDANMAFISEARTDIPALLAHIAELDARHKETVRLAEALAKALVTYSANTGRLWCEGCGDSWSTGNPPEHDSNCPVAAYRVHVAGEK